MQCYLSKFFESAWKGFIKKQGLIESYRAEEKSNGLESWCTDQEGREKATHITPITFSAK